MIPMSKVWPVGNVTVALSGGVDLKKLESKTPSPIGCKGEGTLVGNGL